MPAGLQEVAIAVAIVVAAAVLSLAAGYILTLISKRVSRRTATALDDVVLNSMTGPLRLAIVTAGLQMALRQIGSIPILTRCIALRHT